MNHNYSALLKKKKKNLQRIRRKNMTKVEKQKYDSTKSYLYKFWAEKEFKMNNWKVLLMQWVKMYKVFASTFVIKTGN